MEIHHDQPQYKINNWEDWAQMLKKFDLGNESVSTIQNIKTKKNRIKAIVTKEDRQLWQPLNNNSNALLFPKIQLFNHKHEYLRKRNTVTFKLVHLVSLDSISMFLSRESEESCEVGSRWKKRIKKVVCI